MQQFDSRSDLLRMCQKYLDGNASAEEIQFIEAYYGFFDKEPDVLETYPEDRKLSIGAEMERVIMERNGSDDSHGASVFPLWRRWVAAASVVILMSAGAWFYLRENSKPESMDKASL